MKIPAILLTALVGWVVFCQYGGESAQHVSEACAMWTTASLAAAWIASMTLSFVRVGKIRLDDERLVVRTPFGFYAIPYGRIETIRRCRRKGGSERLEVTFQALGEHKMLELHPGDASRFAARLRGKCPQLSSSSDVVLVKKSGQMTLEDSLARRKRRADPSEAW